MREQGLVDNINKLTELKKAVKTPAKQLESVIHQLKKTSNTNELHGNWAVIADDIANLLSLADQKFEFLIYEMDHSDEVAL